MPLKAARQESDPAHVCVAIRARESCLREDVANGVAVEMLHLLSPASQLLQNL